MRIWVLLLTLVLVGGGLAGCARERRAPAEVIDDAMQATRDAIKDSVEDRQRRGQLLALVDDLEQLLQAQSADLQELSLRLRRLNADPDATRSAFETEVAVYKERRRARRTRALDIHYTMMDLTRPEEWDDIVERELGAMDALQDGGEG